jgi:hypothetical protein
MDLALHPASPLVLHAVAWITVLWKFSHPGPVVSIAFYLM